MTDLEHQAREYAKNTMNHYPPCGNWKIPIKELIADAYIQGWVDRDTRDMKFEDEEEFFKT